MIICNNKDILKSFIGNNRVIKKYLNNEVVYGIPDFAQYYNIQGYDYYNIVGSPTISNGIVSNFSTSNYLTFPAPDLSTSNNWEIATKVNVPRLTNNYQVFFTGSANHPFVDVDINGSGKLLAAIGNSSGNGWQIQESSSSWSGTKKTVPLNTDFWTKITFNGLKYSIYYSADGENWEETIYYESTQKIYHDPTNIVSIGIGRMHNSFVCSGSIDLKETYIKIDGKYYFNGNSNYKELLWCNPNVYLQSSGTQKIDTGITRTTSKIWRFVGKFNYTDTTTRQLNGAQGYVYIGVINNHLQINNVGSSYEDVSAISGKDYVFDVTFDCPHNLLSYIINDTTRNNKSTSYSDSPSGAHFYLFSLNDDVLPSRCKISYWKFFENGTLIRNFVPVPKGLQIGSYKVPSNGMFDIIEQKFYENKGSGEFIWGVDL